MNYKYHLLKYSGKASRLTCPNCGRKHCFVPYVDNKNNIVGEEYGRCNHESSCGYFKYPPTEPDWREYKPRPQRQQRKHQSRVIRKPQRKPSIPDGINTIPMDLVKRTIRMNPPSDFLHFLGKLFDQDTVRRLVEEYNIGVTKSGDAIFYQIDTKGRCRTGKVMKYDRETGHRIKDPTAKTPITWVHSLLKQQGVLPQEWELTQCLFGEHLLNKYPDKIVCLVESEKTAIICAGVAPECIWLATGGKGQLNDRVEILDGKKILAFPDIDGYDTWCEKASERPYLSIIVSDLLVQKASEQDYEDHIDIADILIRWKRGLPIWGPSDEDLPPRQCDFPDNPIMQEIMKYISPEYWYETDSLIREFDLEITGITKNINDK